MKIKDRIKDFRRVPASELLPNPKNWRTHPESQQDAMRGVLAEVGIADAVLVRETPDGLQLIDGHLRADVAPDAEWPVLVLDVTEAEADVILATHDPLAAMANCNEGALESLLQDVDIDNDAVQAMLDELASDAGISDEPTEVVEDEVPEPPADPVTKPGDLWILGSKHRLLCGDSTKAEDVERLMGGDKAHLVFTDPPYGVDYDGGTTSRDKLAGDETTDLYKPCCLMAMKYSDSNAPLYLWHACVKGIAAAAAAAAAAAGYEIRSELVWNKNLAQFGALSAQYKQKHEPCYYCFKRGKPPRWFGPTNEVTVWDCDRSPRNDYHPTQKPVAIAARAIGNSSETGHVVLDLFLGSGTTIIAAEQLNRRCFAIEIEPRYVDVAVERWQNLTGERAVLE